MAKTPDEIWRDWVTDGVPASGAHNPSKPDIRELMNEILEQLEEGSVYFSTPQSYGAVGDGVADDTGALQACLNDGGYILFPSGSIYRITNTVNVMSNTTISGYNAKIVHDTSDLVDVMYIGQRTKVRILGLEVDGKRSIKSSVTNANTRGISLFGCTDVIIEHCHVHDCLEHGIRSSSSESSYTVVAASTKVSITNNVVENNGNSATGRGFGIWFFGKHTDSMITGNRSIVNISGGIGVDDVSSSGPQGFENDRIVIANNTVYDTNTGSASSNTLGIWAGGSQNVVISGNVVFGYRCACMVEDSQANNLSIRTVVTGNTFRGWGVGLMLRSCHEVVVSGNHIYALYPTTGADTGTAIGILVVSWRTDGVGVFNNARHLIDGNTIKTQRSGITQTNPWYNLNGTSVNLVISNNLIIHDTNTVSSGAYGLAFADVPNMMITGNKIIGFERGINLGGTTAPQTKLIQNIVRDSTEFGIALSGAGAKVIGNLTYDNAVGIRFETASNSSTTLVKDNNFLDTSASTGSTSSVQKVNNIGVT